MRWVYLAVVVLLAAAIIIFAIQNIQLVTMSFLSFSARAPLSVLVVAIYFLGMATGSSLLALLRYSLQRSRAPAVR